MKKSKTSIISRSIAGLIILLFVALFLVVCNNINNSIEASKPKISDDISASESVLLQDEFGISLPLKAEITAFSFTEESIFIRIEGVENLPDFLIDSIHLGIDTERSEKLSDLFYQNIKNDTNPFTDMYGNDHQSWAFPTSQYPPCPLDPSTITSIFLMDGKLIIEMQKTNITTDNRQALKDIVVK